jgi:hypothetical protein
MKDAVREYGRTVAIFAAAGLVLSLLVGLLARNPFGVLVLRAVLFAVFFGGVGAGMHYVVRRFLPELTGGGTTGTAAADDAAGKPEGSTIDIVLPEEPLPVAGSSQQRGEVLEELPGTGDAGGASAVEELDAAESTAGPASATTQRTGSPSGSRDGFDALPDIATFGDEAARGGTRRADTRARPAGSRAKPADAARSVLEREDPASLARAVRTVLKREERS